MTHPVRLFDDTSPTIAAMIVDSWRRTPPEEKLRQMCSLNETLRELQRANLARLYPNDTPAQRERRLRVQWYGEELVRQVEGRDSAG